jgi:hypothetical protein
MSVPYPTASVYKIAASVALEPEILPCVLLFRDWKRIKSERVVIPISEPFPQFFRSLCTKVRRAVDAARCDTPEDLFIASSTSIDYLSPVKDSMPDAPKKAKSKPSDTVRPASVFLCHSTRDKKFVERLADDLRRFGLSVWLDKWEIKVGDSIVDRVESGVRDNDYLAVVLSPDSISSAWVSRELNAAYIRELEERRVIILPIVIRKCEIPLRIREKRYADFSVDYVSGLRELLERLEPGAAKNIEDLKFLLRNESHPQE